MSILKKFSPCYPQILGKDPFGSNFARGMILKLFPTLMTSMVNSYRFTLVIYF